MSVYLAVAAGGAVGALARYGVYKAVGQTLGYSYPYGSLTVNILGSLLFGFLSLFLTQKIPVDEAVRVGLTVGMLGAFTTFSAFAMDSLLLIESGNMVRALGYMLSSVVLCIVAVWAGVLIAKQVI